MDKVLFVTTEFSPNSSIEDIWEEHHNNVGTFTEDYKEIKSAVAMTYVVEGITYVTTTLIVVE